MNQLPRPSHSPELHQAVVRLYKQGYTERELNNHRPELVERHRLGSEWKGLNQKTLNRWINKAKENDPDLEVWHVLNRRKRRPGIYTKWEPNGKVILGPFIDKLTETIYTSRAAEFIHVEDLGSWKIIRHDGEHQPDVYKLSDVAAAGVYLAELAFFEYSPRQIVKLWKGEKTRRPSVDKLERVQQLASRLRAIDEQPYSYSKVLRILKVYGHTGQSIDENPWRKETKSWEEET